jgi:Fe-S cluster biogenesis protein NfuA
MSWLGRFLAPFLGESEPGPPYGDPARLAEVMAVIDEMRPMFVADGGDIHLLGIDGGVVNVRLKGACASCAASAATVHQALEQRLRQRLAWVESVRSD